MLSPWLALMLAFAYVLVAIGLGELLRRSLHASKEFTRKFIHIAVGMISVPTVLWFSDLRWAVIPPLAFVVINYLDYRFGIVQAMMSSNRSNLGTVYFPLAFAAILVLFWGDPSAPTMHGLLIVAALMPMTWGDAFAAILGKRFGAHRFAVFNRTRSVEGSLAMFAFSFTATFLALAALSVAQPLAASLALAFAAALVATIVEAFSPWGIDNLTVPLVSAVVLVVLKEFAK